jgi:glycosyltransferase involved in cell wall biosynthesis
MHIGGAENVVVELVRGLDKTHFETALCCTKQLGVLAERLKAESAEVMLAAPPSRGLRYLTPLYLRSAITRFDPDIVHTHGTPSLLHAAPLALFGQLPTWVHTFHYGRYESAGGRQIAAERVLCRLPDQLVAVSESQRRAIAECHRINDRRITTVVNGVSATAGVGSASRTNVRQEVGLSDGDLVVGCVAVLSEQKGISYLLRATRQLVDRNPNVKLLVVGGGPLESALRQEAETLGLGPRVLFTGWRADGVRFFHALDVFVMSSLWEAMPMALLESMAAGNAIVVTRVGDNDQVVENGRCGLVVPPGDPDSIAAAVQRLIDDPAERVAMAARARRRFDDRFTTERMLDSYERMYERLVARQMLSPTRETLGQVR